MRISTRLSLTFSIVVSIFFILFGLAVFFLSADHDKREFENRLEERVVVTEKVFLEKETFTPAEFEKITNDFLQTLDNETEEVINLMEEQTPTFKYNYPQKIKEELLIKENYIFSYGDIQGVSRVFNVKNIKYLIIVTATDTVAIQNQAFLKNRIILLISLAIPLLFLISYFISRSLLLPISEKIEKANLIGVSNLHLRLNVDNPYDELGKLAIAFNSLLDRLEASFESQRSFISNASHEIKNPLTAILGEAEVAFSKDRSREEYKECLSKIITETESLNITVSNLLQLSNIASAEINFKKEAILIADFIKEIKVSFDFLNPQNRIDLSNLNDTSIELLTVEGNKQFLKTAILNVLDNACKFSNNKPVKVLLQKGDEFLRLSIRDQGIGIDQDEIDKVSTPFYRGKNALKIKGSGIGLALTSKIIFIHKGHIKIESVLGEGSSVDIYLPNGQ